jgi:hypothetical protein
LTSKAQRKASRYNAFHKLVGRKDSSVLNVVQEIEQYVTCDPARQKALSQAYQEYMAKPENVEKLDEVVEELNAMRSGMMITYEENTKKRAGIAAQHLNKLLTEVNCSSSLSLCSILSNYLNDFVSLMACRPSS